MDFDTTGDTCNSWSASLLLVTPGAIPCQQGHEQDASPKNISDAEAEDVGAGGGAGVDEGLGVMVGVTTIAGSQATNVKINNKLSLFIFLPTLKRIRQSVNLSNV